MATLEYRLDDAEQGYPALYHYPDIAKDELSLRLLCDFFTKDGVVYEKTSTALEDKLHMIYVQRSTGESPTVNNLRSTVGMGFIVLEIREFREGSKDYPLLEAREFNTILDLILYAQVDCPTFNEMPWEKKSLEVDEDRKVYVLYLQQTH
ncbi:MAG: hypothetical protein ACYCVD_11770 [Desulfitobacteriaceae bacterium]